MQCFMKLNTMRCPHCRSIVLFNPTSLYTFYRNRITNALNRYTVLSMVVTSSLVYCDWCALKTKQNREMNDIEKLTCDILPWAGEQTMAFYCYWAFEPGETCNVLTILRSILIFIGVPKFIFFAF